MTDHNAESVMKIGSSVLKHIHGIDVSLYSQEELNALINALLAVQMARGTCAGKGELS